MNNIWLLSLVLVVFAGPARSENLDFEVYRNDDISVAASIVDLERKIVNFGDVLSLAITINYADGQVSVPQIPAEFFTDVWPESQGAYLLDHRMSEGSVNGRAYTRTVFDFQIMACPDEEILCRGTREYAIPEFSLAYNKVDDSGNAVPAETVLFRPWPSTVMIASAIPLGEEGELTSFPAYFPTGGFPDPLSAEADASSAGLIAGSLLLLLGGILMSPFSFFKRASSVQKTRRRWEDVLEKIQRGEYQDDAHLFDAIRKCLVWYCADELRVDPFYWVKHEEEVSGKEQRSTEEYGDYRQLFLDLLCSPQGQGVALTERLSALVKARA
jgi:hypothetical protein